MVAPKKNDSKYIWYRYPYRLTFLSISSASKIIGISKSSLQKKVKSGCIPFVKINNRAFMREKDVYLEKGRREGKTEIDVVHLWKNSNGTKLKGTFYLGSESICEMMKILGDGNFQCEKIKIYGKWPTKKIVSEILDLDKHFVDGQVVFKDGVYKRQLIYGVVGLVGAGKRARLVNESVWVQFKDDFLKNPKDACEKMFLLKNKGVFETVKNQPPIAMDKGFIFE